MLFIKSFILIQKESLNHNVIKISLLLFKKKAPNVYILHEWKNITYIFERITFMAASRINILAVSSQIAGTVRTKLMSLILNESSMKPLHIVFKRWSFRYRMLWVKTSIASNSRPFSSLHLVSLWTLWNIVQM